MEGRNRSSRRRTGAAGDTELEPSEEFPILYGLLTAPKSHRPKSREQMRNLHKPIAIEADSSLEHLDYDPSTNDSHDPADDDSPSPDENDDSIIFNYLAPRPVYDDDEEEEDDGSGDDNSPTSTTSNPKTVAARRRQFCYSRRPRRRTGRILQRDKAATGEEMPLLEAMVTSSPKVSTTSDFEISKPAATTVVSSTHRILRKSASNSTPPTLVPAVNVNVNVKVQTPSQSSQRSLLVTNNEIMDVYPDQPMEELRNLVSASKRCKNRNSKKAPGEDETFNWPKSRYENVASQSKKSGDSVTQQLVNTALSSTSVVIPKKRAYSKSLDSCPPHLVKAMKLAIEEKPYKCTECDLSFSKASLLNRHMHTHLGDQVFQCELCSNCFRRRDNLLAHMRTSCKGIKVENKIEVGRVAQTPKHVQNNYKVQHVTKKSHHSSSNAPVKMNFADLMKKINSVATDNDDPTLSNAFLTEGSNVSNIHYQEVNIEPGSKLPFDLEIEEVCEFVEPTNTQMENLNSSLSKSIWPKDSNNFIPRSVEAKGNSVRIPVSSHRNVSGRNLVLSKSMKDKRSKVVVKPPVYIRKPQNINVININEYDDTDNEESENEEEPIIKPVPREQREAFPCGHCNAVFRDMDRLLKHTETHSKSRIVERIQIEIE